MPVSSANVTRSPSVSTTRLDKNKRPSLVVVLKLSRALLKTFEPPSTQEEEQSAPSIASSPAPVPEDASILKNSDTNDNASESNAPPGPTSGDANSTDSSKKRKAPGSALKRSLGSAFDINGMAKPRGKPGPKKKPRLEDGTIDHGTNRPSPAVGGIAITGHKLGPKANQGAINAGLRALDRSGKPCRKWHKKPFQLKSFTGIMWDVPSWRGNDRAKLVNGDEPSDTQEISQQSSSDLKPNESDTAVDSNAGDQPDPMAISTPAASSPVPMPEPTATAITAQG